RTGARLLGWIVHGAGLTDGIGREADLRFFHLLSAQVDYLSDCWRDTAAGLPRITALTALTEAGCRLEGKHPVLAPAVRGLGDACAGWIADDGSIASRNPEDLLEAFWLLVLAAQSLERRGVATASGHSAAIARVAPVLRTLRHADGGLARFHGGGRGAEGRIERALALSGIRPGPPGDSAMGYRRLQGGRTTIVVDAASRGGRERFESLFAFEMTHGRAPIVTGSGPGRAFGAAWARRSRLAAGYSGLAIEGGGIGEPLPAELQAGAAGRQLRLQRRFPNAAHQRVLNLSLDGTMLTGEDFLAPAGPGGFGRHGPEYALRFHLHPTVQAEALEDGTTLHLLLPGGEVWTFRSEAPVSPMLLPAVFLDPGEMRPLAARQIVLSGRAQGDGVLLNWTFAKARARPQAT
ncbi:heparinase II/III domain-containing protein, partial [Tropicimonas sp.]|uniref:heparinase II/III domain-containing protein n=1 Tax=Tropicimonas sp. TaxID=2067044 RepID=UPI003A87F8EB